MTAEDLAHQAHAALRGSIRWRCYIVRKRSFWGLKWRHRTVTFREGQESEAIAVLVKDIARWRFNRFGIFPSVGRNAGADIAVSVSGGMAVRAAYQFSLLEGKLGRLDVLGSRKDASQ